MAVEELARYGWDADWARVLRATAGRAGDRSGTPLVPGRVARHDGVAVAVATAGGTVSVPLRRGLDVPPVVGDWVALRDGGLASVLPRRSLLERRATRRQAAHPLVANVDLILIACGLDRPLNPGRIERTATLAWEAGATPSIVLTKTDLSSEATEPQTIARDLAARHANLSVHTTSSRTGRGIPELRQLIGNSTAALMGESGSGKSSLVNALLGTEVAATGDVRARDRKGRHTTTTRELHLLPGGGVLVDTPGLRSIGIWADTDAVDATFDDVTERAQECRFRDCTHRSEPGCAVRAGVEAGDLDPRRLAAYHALEEEAADRPSSRSRGDRR